MAIVVDSNDDLSNGSFTMNSSSNLSDKGINSKDQDVVNKEILTNLEQVINKHVFAEPSVPDATVFIRDDELANENMTASVSSKCESSDVVTTETIVSEINNTIAPEKIFSTSEESTNLCDKTFEAEISTLKDIQDERGEKDEAPVSNILTVCNRNDELSNENMTASIISESSDVVTAEAIADSTVVTEKNEFFSKNIISEENENTNVSNMTLETEISTLKDIQDERGEKNEASVPDVTVCSRNDELSNENRTASVISESSDVVTAEAIVGEISSTNETEKVFNIDESDDPDENKSANLSNETFEAEMTALQDTQNENDDEDEDEVTTYNHRNPFESDDNSNDSQNATLSNARVPKRKEFRMPYFELQVADLDDYLLETESSFQIPKTEISEISGFPLTLKPKDKDDIIFFGEVSSKKCPENFENSYKNYKNTISDIEKLDDSRSPGIKRLALKNYLQKKIEEKKLIEFKRLKELRKLDAEEEEELILESDLSEEEEEEVLNIESVASFNNENFNHQSSKSPCDDAIDDNDDVMDDNDDAVDDNDDAIDDNEDAIDDNDDAIDDNEDAIDDNNDAICIDDSDDDDGIFQIKKKPQIIKDDSSDDESSEAAIEDVIVSDEKSQSSNKDDDCLNIKLSGNKYSEDTDRNDSQAHSDSFLKYTSSNDIDNHESSSSCELSKSKKSFMETSICSSLPSFQPGGGFQNKEDEVSEITETDEKYDSLKIEDQYLRNENSRFRSADELNTSAMEDKFDDNSLPSTYNNPPNFALNLIDPPISQTESLPDIFSTQDIANVCSGVFKDENIQEKEFDDENASNCTDEISQEKIKDFFDNEAELSGEDDGLDDISDDGCDEMDKINVIDDSEIPAEEELREEIAYLHMKHLRDDDEDHLKEIQEILLDDGELNNDGIGRTRKFAWKNNDMVDSINKDNDSSSDSDGPVEENWSSMCKEKAKWREENEKEDITAELCSSNKKIFLKRQIIGKLEFAKKGGSSGPISNKRARGSFLHLDDNSASQVLKKLKTSEGESGGSRTTKHFVFRNGFTEDQAKETPGNLALKNPTKRASSGLVMEYSNCNSGSETVFNMI